MVNQVDGSWGDLDTDFTVMGIHSVVMEDGRVLTFGTDHRGMAGGEFRYEIYDPITGEHEALTSPTPTNIFCSAAVLIPGTNQVLIAGGDASTLGNPNAGVSDINIFDMDTGEIVRPADGDMEFQRWYPTLVSLPTGQLVILGGLDADRNGIDTPEIYTPGEGWTSLTGAIDSELAVSDYYPRTFVDTDGTIVYFATTDGENDGYEVYRMDPTGLGSLEQIYSLPFTYNEESPAVMYEAGKVLIQDADNGLWSMDIYADPIEAVQVGVMSDERNWSNMSPLPDGTVLITGGSGDQNLEAAANRSATIWDPSDNSLYVTTEAEDNPRLYHSTSTLLVDGTVLSMGGGAADFAENSYIDGQIYRPAYLYDENNELAERPVILEAPDEALPGDELNLMLEDASDIVRVTLVKTTAVTHSFNMEARLLEVEYEVGVDGNLILSLPDMSEGLVPGNYMIFAWNADGVPAIAPIISVLPDADFIIGSEPVDPIDPTLPPIDNVIDGTDGDDMWVYATQENDRFDGLAGDDSFIETAGFDQFNGGEGRDHMIYQGVRGDYTFTRNADESITVGKDNDEFDTLTGIEYVWFNGENAAAEIDDLVNAVDPVEPTLPPVENVIDLTNGDDLFVVGTDQNDQINGLNGDDSFKESGGSDQIDGGEGQNQMIYEGNVDDYTFTRNTDGTITVEKPEGQIDILSNIDSFWFNGDSFWAWDETLAPELEDEDNSLVDFGITDVA